MSFQYGQERLRNDVADITVREVWSQTSVNTKYGNSADKN